MVTRGSANLAVVWAVLTLCAPAAPPQARVVHHLAAVQAEASTRYVGWPQPGGSASRSFTGSDSEITAASAAHLRLGWHNPTGDPYGFAQPVIANHVVYQPCRHGNGLGLCAWRANTGQQLWWRPISNGIATKVGAAEMGGRVFQGWDHPGGTARVLAYAASTGSVLWRWSDPTPSQQGLAHDSVDGLLGYRGRVFVSTNDGYLTGLDAATGRVLWHRYSGSYQPGSGLQVEAGANGYVYATGPINGSVYVLRPVTGKQVWSDVGSGNLSIGGGRVVVANPSRVTAFAEHGCSQSTCPPLWQRALDTSYDINPGAIDSQIVAISLVSNQNTGKLYVLNARTGQTKWQTNIAAGPGTVTRNRDVLLVATYSDEHISAYPVGCHNGCTPLWSVQLGAGYSNGFSDISVSDGRIYINTTDHGLRTYRP